MATLPDPNAVIGKPIDRRDGRAKVMGTVLYAADHPIRGVLHAVMVTSTIASGRITRLDAGHQRRPARGRHSARHRPEEGARRVSVRQWRLRLQGLDLVARRAGRDSGSHTSTFEDFVEPAALATRILYTSDARATSHKLVKRNVGSPTFQRAPGEAPGTFALESAIDEMAERACIDPLEMRNPQSHRPESRGIAVVEQVAARLQQNGCRTLRLVATQRQGRQPA